MKMRRARQRFEVHHGRAPTVEELAEAAQLELGHAQEALEAVEVSASLNQTIGDGDQELGDLFADNLADDPVELAGASLERRRLRDALAQLDERERRVLELRFGIGSEPCTLAETARRTGSDVPGVRRLERRALDRLRRRPAMVQLQEAAGA